MRSVLLPWESRHSDETNGSAPHAGDSTIREALAIRSIVLPILANGTVTEAGCVTLTRATEAAWRLFLRAECCATPVAGALRRCGLFDGLPAAITVVLRAAESRELQRSLSAQAQLRQIDLLAYASGLSATVLKGGAMAAEGVVIDLGDVDIASGAPERDTLWAALIGCGYAAGSGVAPAAAAPGAIPRSPSLPFGKHFPPLTIGGGLPIELHLAHVSDATRPLRGFRSLVRCVGGAPLYDMLLHVVVQHTFRRGHLRDLIVLADAIGTCRADELAEVRARCRRNAHSDELIAMLDQSTAIATGAPISDPGPTRQIVARKYTLVAGREAWVSRAVPRWPARLAFVPLERASLRRSELASLFRDKSHDHPVYQLRRLRTYAPRVADLMGALMATGYHALLAGAVAGAGPLIRHRMKRLLNDPPLTYKVPQ